MRDRLETDPFGLESDLWNDGCGGIVGGAVGAGAEGELITPPDLTGFVAYCESCEADRTLHLAKEADAGTGEVYYEYICD